MNCRPLGRIFSFKPILQPLLNSRENIQHYQSSFRKGDINGDTSWKLFQQVRYRNAFGDNPWLGPTRSLMQWTSGLGNTVFGSGSAGTTGSTSGGSTRSYVANPGDSAVQNYMSHVMGGQRNALRDYVRQAAGAGIKRGGMNVVGGPALDSALHHSATQNLAKGYADRFREAMNYNKYLKGTAYSQQNDSIRNLQNLLGLQHQYLGSQAGWNSSLGDMMRSDYLGDVDWNRGARDREWAERDRVYDYQAKQRALSESLKRKQDIDQIEGLSSVLDPPGGTSPRDWSRYLRALIGEGYRKPM